MPLLCHSLRTVLRPIVSALVGAKAVPKGQVSERPTRATTCCTPTVFCLFLFGLLHAAI